MSIDYIDDTTPHAKFGYCMFSGGMEIDRYVVDESSLPTTQYSYATLRVPHSAGGGGGGSSEPNEPPWIRHWWKPVVWPKRFAKVMFIGSVLETGVYQPIRSREALGREKSLGTEGPPPGFTTRGWRHNTTQEMQNPASWCTAYLAQIKGSC